MAVATHIFWRKVTDGDFLCVERSSENTPSRGGGQTYFSVSFGAHLDKDEFGEFLGLDRPHRIVTERPRIPIDAKVLAAPTIVEEIEFQPRYTDPEDRRDRYYIARQNRQRANQVRHPAWTADRGFPIAPDDVAAKDDPRMPDLSQLKLLVVRDSDGAYYADYVNADTAPEGTPAELDVLFQPNSEAPADGLIVLGTNNALELGDLVSIVEAAHRLPRGTPTSDEVEDAIDATARLAGARSRRGQGFRQSAAARTAIDRHAMALATEHMESLGWDVKDRSIDHSYDLECKKETDTLHVEVKGTTSAGTSVLLTPKEVEFARDTYPAMALLIVHDITLVEEGEDHVSVADGKIELINPWGIDAAGVLTPTGFSYERKSVS